MVVGDGCREYAIAKRLINEAHSVVSFQVRHNWGLERICQSSHLSSNFNPSQIISVARLNRVDGIIVGTEKAIFRGLGDVCSANRIPCYAPVAEAAQLEENRAFAKNLVREAQPEMVCPFAVVHDSLAAEAFMKQHGSSVVLKGNSAGVEYGMRVFIDDIPGAMAEVLRGLRIGLPVLIEKYVEGKEFTQYCFTDGYRFFFPKIVRDFPFRSATSHQKTGGMGSISFEDVPPDITPADMVRAQKCIKATLEKLNHARGVRFQGVLAGQFIKSGQSLFFNEFDVRPGDSEFINILASLDTPLSEIMHATLISELNNVKTNASNTVCIYHVPITYPTSVRRQRFTLPKWFIESQNVVFGNMTYDGQSFCTGPGRTLVVTSTAADFHSARQQAIAISDALGTGLYYRRDIGRDEELSLLARVAE
jgi:phosphoribosylamine---glycine ligase